MHPLSRFRNSLVSYTSHSILNAGEAAKDKFIGYIIAPSTIYGLTKGSFGNPISIQIPDLIEESIKHGQTIYAGPGECLCSFEANNQ